jgi:hypothetical protein
MSASPLFLVILAITGCAERSPFTTTRAAQYGQALGPSLLSATVGVYCGARSIPRGDLTIVALTAEKCLGCEGVGYVLRTMGHEAERRVSRLVVVVPDSALGLVCPYLGKERLLERITVLGVPSLPWHAHTREDGYLTYFLNGNRSISKARFVRRAAELLGDTLHDQ